MDVVGTYAAHYEATTGQVTYERIDRATLQPPSSSGTHALDYNSTTGVSTCLINDKTKASNAINYCMGLVDPDSCSTDYNSTTHILSFYAKMVNKTNSTYYSNPNYEFANLAADHDVTFLAPFYFKVKGLDWSPAGSQLITSVNTNLAGAECGANGLTLTNDDVSPANNRFDCIMPDQAYTVTDSTDPGWDFTPYVTNGDMTPGEDTGCTQFMQFTLTQNASFTLTFDLLAVRQTGGTTPSTPTITPALPSYTKTSPITVAGTCTTGDTVYVEGGDSAVVPYPRSGSCAGSAFSISVDLNLNVTNTLQVYQVDAGSHQSGSASVQITHDNVAPVVLGMSPANGETAVNPNRNCIFSFSEPMLSSTITASTFTMTKSGTPVAGSVALSTDGMQAVFTPTTKPLTSGTYICALSTGATDLAGNSVTAATASFTTTGTVTDTNIPEISWIYPTGNSQNVPTGAKFTIQFSEPVASNTVVGNVIDATCSASIPNIFLAELHKCLGVAVASPQIIPGATSLNALGDVATFTVTTPPLTANKCYVLGVSSCVKDLSGNKLTARGTRTVTAYGTTTAYNTLNYFTTGSADVAGPILVHVSPMGSPLPGATSATEMVFPFLVFSEPIDPAIMTGSNFYMTKFGTATHPVVSIKPDPSMQMITLSPIVVPPATASLSNSQLYNITATGGPTVGVKDLSGNLMSAPQTSQFQTKASADTTGPYVALATPGTGNQPQCSIVDIYFSEPVDPNTITTSTIQLKQGATVKSGSLTISDDGLHVRFVPDSSLAKTRVWTITVSSSVKDRAQNGLTVGGVAGTFTQSFTAVQDILPPNVSKVLPAATGAVPKNASFIVRFSETMARPQLIDGRFSLNNCATDRTVYAVTDAKTVVIDCADYMTAGAMQLNINSNIKDYNSGGNDNVSCDADNGLTVTGTGNFNFTIANTVDTTAPTVTTVTPANNATSVATNTSPTILFSEEMDPRTIIPSTVFLMDRNGNYINSRITLSSDAKTVTIAPVENLPSTGFFYIVATTALRDLGGGNAYVGEAGTPGVLRTCFSTDATSCP